MMKPEYIAEIANVIADRLNFEDYYWGFGIPDELQEEFEDCREQKRYSAKKIYEKMCLINSQSFHERYYGYPPFVPDINVEDYVIHQKKQDNDYVQPWHYRLIKLLDYYFLEIDKSNMREGVGKFSLSLSNFIVMNSPQYKEIDWDTFELER